MSDTLALFDLDGTLTKRDTLLDFIFYSIGLPKVIWNSILLSPTLLKYKLGFYDNEKAKEKVISHFFKGWEKKKFTELGLKYSKNRLPKILKTSGIKKLNWHISCGHQVAIVSASIEDWIIGWTNKLGIELIATKLEDKEGFLTGKFKTKNCYGIEKVNRIKTFYNLNEYVEIYGYGDTKGDKPMLNIVNNAYYRSFD